MTWRPFTGAAAASRQQDQRARNRARRDVKIDRGASLPERLDALWEAWVGGFLDIVARLGMEWAIAAELESFRHWQ